MKYVLSIQFPDLIELGKRRQRLHDVSEKMKEVAPTMEGVSPAYAYPDMSGGFQIIEAENVEEVAALAAFYEDIGEISISPIVEADELLKIRDQVSKL